MKKNLATRLRERTETIEYRSIISRLNNTAQTGRKEFLIINMQPDTICRLQNEGITIERFKEFGTMKYRLTWAETREQQLAQSLKWKVDFAEKHISVPQSELTEAEENAMVLELRSLGFHIQSAIA